MKRILLITALVATMVACTDPRQQRVNELREEAIALHDEVMPKMGEVMELSTALKNKRMAIMDVNDSAQDLKTKYTVAIAQLEVAHEGMMAWMDKYEPTYEENNPLDSAVVYYEAQRDAIKMVKQSMESSIEQAQRLKDEAR